MILGENISLSRENKLVLDTISFTCLPGQISVFIGESGAGKTSALRVVAGLEKKFSGKLMCANQDISKLDSKTRAMTVGFVAQNYILFPNLTALENCELALKTTLGFSKIKAKEVALSALNQVGMSDYAKRLPSQLSGGQKQRVAIARALALKPQILLLDEPSSALDPNNVESLSMLLKNLSAQNMTIIISSQDMRFVKLIYDYIYIFNDGKIVENATRESLDQNKDSKINALLSYA